MGLSRCRVKSRLRLERRIRCTVLQQSRDRGCCFGFMSCSGVKLECLALWVASSENLACESSIFCRIAKKACSMHGVPGRRLSFVGGFCTSSGSRLSHSVLVGAPSHGDAMTSVSILFVIVVRMWFQFQDDDAQKG